MAGVFPLLNNEKFSEFHSSESRKIYTASHPVLIDVAVTLATPKNINTASVTHGVASVTLGVVKVIIPLLCDHNNITLSLV